VVPSRDATGTTGAAGSPSADDADETDDSTPIAYVQWGPADPVIPEHYTRLAQDPPDCVGADSTSPGGPFWDAVVDVCRALAGDGPWPALESAPQAPATENPHDRCLDEEMAAMLGRALRWHQEGGDSTPEVTRSGTGSACYTTVYDVREVEDGTDTSGPIDQATVDLILDSTFSVRSVAVDGEDVDPDHYESLDNDLLGTRTLRISIPRPGTDEEAVLAIDLEDSDGTARGTASAAVLIRGGQAVPSSGQPDAEGSPGPGDLPDAASSDAVPTSG
jgi:hypothetical protein